MNITYDLEIPSRVFPELWKQWPARFVMAAVLSLDGLPHCP